MREKSGKIQIKKHKKIRKHLGNLLSPQQICHKSQFNVSGFNVNYSEPLALFFKSLIGTRYRYKSKDSASSITSNSIIVKTGRNFFRKKLFYLQREN